MLNAEIIIAIFISGILLFFCYLMYIQPPTGFKYNKSVDKLINEKLDKYEITDICPEAARIGDIRIWHHRDGIRVVTLYGHHIGSTFDIGCATRKTTRRVFKKMGGMKGFRRIQFEYEQKYLKKALENKSYYS